MSRASREKIAWCFLEDSVCLRVPATLVWKGLLYTKGCWVVLEARGMGDKRMFSFYFLVKGRLRNHKPGSVITGESWIGSLWAQPCPVFISPMRMTSLRSVDQEQWGFYKRQCLLCNRRVGGQHAVAFGCQMGISAGRKQITLLCDLQGSRDTEFYFLNKSCSNFS